MKMLLMHLHTGVKRTEMLVERCCCENSSWLSTASNNLGRHQRGSYFHSLGSSEVNIHVDSCCSFSRGTCSFGVDDGLNFLKTGEGVYQRQLEKFLSSSHVVQKAALKDHEEMLKKISCLVKLEDGQCADEYIRGVYVTARINHTEEYRQSVQELKKYAAISTPFLGSGASGSVMQVKWLGQQSALKKQKVVDNNEATILKQLQHPNIVRFFHYWEDPTPRSYMLMELMSDLRQHIGRPVAK